MKQDEDHLDKSAKKLADEAILGLPPHPWAVADDDLADFLRPTAQCNGNQETVITLLEADVLYKPGLESDEAA